ncbi:MAG: hypothetical protein RRY08_02605 [Christensenella sp.]
MLLQRYGNLRRRIKDCNENIRELYAEKNSCTDKLLCPAKLGRESQRSNISGDPVYSTVQLMVDVYDVRIAEATEYLKRLCAEHDDIERTIEAAMLTADETDYLRMRYVEKRSVMVIANIMNYSERQTQRVRLALLRAIGRAMGK